MNCSRKLIARSLAVCSVLLLTATGALAQQARGSLRGLVTDELGAAVVGANVVLSDIDGAQKATTTTNDQGVYTFAGIPPGKYFILAAAPGFAGSDPTEVELTAGARRDLDLVLRVTIEEKVTVAAETPLSTEATNNANQTLISGKDLDALPDDPDELAAALQALAGPSVGPNGGQIYIDGFSGGRMPPKESIREIRVNQNPFAAENDFPSGRVDILTKPGTDKLRGSSYMNFEDESLNSRNPFSDSRTPYQVRNYGGSLSGPIIKNRASFFIDVDRRETDDNELVRATVLNDDFNEQELGFGVVTPRRNLNFGPRIDYQINPTNTLIARYTYFRTDRQNNGVGGFSLPERAFDSFTRNHTIQLTETAVLNPSMINEVRFQYAQGRNESLGDNSTSTLNVSSAFMSGGSQVGHVINTDRRWELTNFLQWQKGNHTFKFGGRIRRVSLTDINPNNFGGTYVFTGGFVPTLDENGEPIFTQPVFASSLERYRRTLVGQELRLTPNQIRALGGGASQFSISDGNPEASVSQFDAGLYAQDDWRVRQNLTLSFGLRYENQTNIEGRLNFAPRLAVAWSPGAADASRPPKTVIRAGAGVFYNRFNENQTLQARRFNGLNQQQFSVAERPLYESVNGILVFVPPPPTPLDAFPSLPETATLTPARQIQWRVAEDLTAPTVYLAGAQVERQLPYRFTATVGFYAIRIQHVIRARDINAPLPGSITVLNPQGTRPFGNVGEIYQYESSGRFDQNQLFISVNNRFSRTFTFFANYSLSKTQNDTDGQGGALFPANSYDLSGEYGRAAFDIRHRFTLAGTINLPWWQVSVNPFITALSGRPFNITTGQDTTLDRLFTERPSFAAAGVDCDNPPARVVCTPFGNFNLNPAPGEALIPRNFGQGPGFFTMNLRISKTWSFGDLPGSNGSGQAGGERRGGGGGGPRGGGRMPNIPGSGGGGGGGPRGGGGGFPGPGGAAGGEAKRYTMQFSINFNNLLNNVNLAAPVGNLSSPSFGQSLSLAPAFGGFGGGGGTGVGNRRVSAQVRFNF